MKTTWIVAADGGRARIFSDADPAMPMQEIEDMVDAAAGMRAAETDSDRVAPKAAGKSSHGTGGALPTKLYEDKLSHDDRAAESFARDINAYLLKARQEGKFDRLALVAEPRFLGVLRRLLDPQLKSLVCDEIDRDYTHSSVRQMDEQLRAHRDKRE